MQSSTTHENAVKLRKCQRSTPQAIVVGSPQKRNVHLHTFLSLALSPHTHTYTHRGRTLKVDKGGNCMTNFVQWSDD